MINFFARLWRRLLYYWRREQFDADLEQEIRFHLQMKAEENISAGMSAEEARRAARRQFGNQTWLREESRQMWGFTSIGTLIQDLRFGLRMMAGRPAFSGIAIMTLVLGIGASTIIFSIVDGVLLRPLPYPAPERLVQLKEVSERGTHSNVTEPNFNDVRAGSHTLAALTAYGGGVMTITGGTEPVRAGTYAVSEDFFKALGVQPMVGRVFAAEENKVGGVAVVSYGFWQRLLGAKNDLSGTRLNILGQSFVVVGVMPPGFQFPSDAEVWIPRAIFPPNTSRTAHNWQVIGRLRADASLERASADVSSIAQQFKAQLGNDVDAVDMALVPLRDYLVGGTRPVLMVMLAAVGLLLLIACANVANLLLAQVTARYKEFAIRRALGADSSRLARQFITESALLALAASTVGVLLAFWGVDALLSLNQERCRAPPRSASTPES